MDMYTLLYLKCITDKDCVAPGILLHVMWQPAWEGSLGDLPLILGQEDSPGEGYGNPLQYSYLGNSMNIGAWWATDHGVAKIRT